MNKMPINAKKYEQSYYYGSTSMSRAKQGNARQTKQSRPQRKQKEERTENIEKQNTKMNNEEELPKALTNKIKIENPEEVSIDKTTEILNQINQYLDEEKKKLK